MSRLPVGENETVITAPEILERLDRARKFIDLVTTCRSISMKYPATPVFRVITFCDFSARHSTRRLISI